MEYNTTRSSLILREYGRNFHKLVDHIKGIKEKEKSLREKKRNETRQTSSVYQRGSVIRYY